MELCSISLYQLNIKVKNLFSFTKRWKSITTPNLISLTFSRSKALFSKKIFPVKKFIEHY